MIALFLLVALAIVGLYLTRPSAGPQVQTRSRRPPLVDEQPVKTARALSALVSTPEERRYAMQALRLADHEVDLEFSYKMREAVAHPAKPSPETKGLFERIQRAEAQVKGDQDIIDDLKKEAAAHAARAGDFDSQINLMQAQLELDQDELEDAKGDLLRSGADDLSRIQRQFARYQAAQQKNDAALPPANDQTPPEPGHNLISQFLVWRSQRQIDAQLKRAHDDAAANHDKVQQEHDRLEQQTETPAAAPSDSSGDSSQAVIASLRRLATKQKSLSDLDKRIQDFQDLSDAYGNWGILVASRQRAAMNSMIQSVLWILLIVLAVYITDRLIDKAFSDITPERKSLRTLRVIAKFAVQAMGVLLLIFVIFGIPSQMSTILGLAGAGLTVALKDFIVAFFGWFVLMGRNGLRIGDWVEINGVAGEVVEINLLRTVLLETGNWNDAGHPTGRKVAFVNSFAIEGHFFNFSTSGQWLWDELEVVIPSSENPYPLIEAIQKVVTELTANNSRMAEEEWRRATNRQTMQSFSAAPAVNVRPTGSGVQVLVRYITRAQERYEMRSRLYQQVVELLHRKPAETAPRQ